MRTLDIIIKKRDGFELSREEINFIIDGYISGNIPDYQVSSLLMAIFFQGMSFEETANLTEIMKNSGKILRFDNIKKTKVDKHSTGGVGDKISLIVAPIVASCGGVIPMMSGRGLGHTGGTLDKLESIKGYNVFLNTNEIERILNRCNYVMMGQTADFVPADRLLYSLRDATGTVESIPLIVSSIMSKKIAEGTDTLLLDLKCGRGAFLKKIEDCEKMANYMLGVANKFNMKMKILITDMDSPLGREVGNFNEVKEALDILNNKINKDNDKENSVKYGNSENSFSNISNQTYNSVNYDNYRSQDFSNAYKRLKKLSIEIAKQMLYIAEIEKDLEKCEKMVNDSIATGKALEYFYRNVEEQGGDLAFLEKYYKDDRELYKYSEKIVAEKDGFLDINAYKVGLSSMYIGCGRAKKEDSVDHYAGITVLKNSGDFVKKGDVIFEIKYNRGDINSAINMCKDAILYNDKPVKMKNIIIKEFQNF